MRPARDASAFAASPRKPLLLPCVRYIPRYTPGRSTYPEETMFAPQTRNRVLQGRHDGGPSTLGAPRRREPDEPVATGFFPRYCESWCPGESIAESMNLPCMEPDREALFRHAHWRPLDSIGPVPIQKKRHHRPGFVLTGFVSFAHGRGEALPFQNGCMISKTTPETGH